MLCKVSAIKRLWSVYELALWTKIIMCTYPHINRVHMCSCLVADKRIQSNAPQFPASCHILHAGELPWSHVNSQSARASK